MLKHSVSSVELRHRSLVGERRLEEREFRRKLHSVGTDNGVEDSIKADTSLPSSSTGSSYSADINRNFSGQCSLVSSEVDRWLSSEILAPLASREDSRLTNELKRSKSFCYGELRNFSETESESKSFRCDLFPTEGKTKKVCDLNLEYSSAQKRKVSNISRSDDFVDEIYWKGKEKFCASESEDNAKLIDKIQENITVCPDEKRGSENDSLVQRKLVSDQNDVKGTNVNVSLIDESIIKHSGSETEDDFTDIFDDEGDIISVNNHNDSDDPVNQNADIVQTDQNSLKTLTNSNDPGQQFEQSVNIVHSSNLSPEACKVKCVTVQVSINSDEEEIRATPNQQKFIQLNNDQSPGLHVSSNSYTGQDFVNSGGKVLPVVAVDTQVKEDLNILSGSNGCLETNDEHAPFGLYREEFYFPQNSLQNADRDKEQYLIEEFAINDDGRKWNKSNDDNADNIACREEKFEDIALDQKIRSLAKDSIGEVEGISHTKLDHDEILKTKANEATIDLQNTEYTLGTRSVPDFDKEDSEDSKLHPYPGINTEVKVDSLQSTVVQTKIDCTEVTQEDNTLSLPDDPSGEKTSLPNCSTQVSVEIQEKGNHVSCNQSEVKEHEDNYYGQESKIDSNTVKETEREPACSIYNSTVLQLTETRAKIGEFSTKTIDHPCEENIKESEVIKEKEDNISDSVALSKEFNEEQLINSHCVLHTLDQSSKLKEKPLRHPVNISDNLLDENHESNLQNICDPCAIKAQEFHQEEPLNSETKSFPVEGGDANSIAFIGGPESVSLTEVKETGTDVPKGQVTSETTQSDKGGCGEKVVTNTLNVSSVTKHQEGFCKEEDSKSFILENDVPKIEIGVVNNQSLQVHCNEPNNQREELGKAIDIALPIQSSYFKCQRKGNALSSLEKSVPSEASEQEKDNSHSYMYTYLNYKRCMTENHLCLEDNQSKENTERDENTIDSKDQTEKTVCLKKDSQCCKIDNIDNSINISKESGVESKPEEKHYIKENIPGDHLTFEEVYNYSLEEIGKGILPTSQRCLSKTEPELHVGSLNQVKMNKEDLACESLISEKQSYWTPNTDKSSVNAKSSKCDLAETEDTTIRQMVEKDEREVTSDNWKTGKEKREKKKRRMNSDSALLYEKSRYSLGILLEEIHDLVRKTQSFECSELDIRYNPVKDVGGSKVDLEKEISVAKSDDRENNLTTDSSNLLGFVELYTDVGKQGTEFSGSCKEATSENIIATMESNDSGLFQVKGKIEVESERCKMDSKLCKTDFSELSRDLDQSGQERRKSVTKAKPDEKHEERPVVENSWHGDLRLVTDPTLQPGTDTSPPKSRTEFSCIDEGEVNLQKDKNAEYVSPQNSSVSLNKEQKRKFPLRMLRRKSVVTSLSLLDEVDDPSVGKRNTSDMDYSRQKETVGVSRNVSNDEIERLGRENRSFSRDALDQSRSGDSFENIGRGRENANVYGWKKSPSKKLSSSCSYSESNYLTSSDQNWIGKEASVHKSSSTGISNTDRARQQKDSYSAGDKTLLPKSASSHLPPPSKRETRNDKYTSSKTLHREKTSDQRSDLSTMTSRQENSDRLPKRSSMDGSSTYGKQPYNMDRIGNLSKSQAISTEGLSAFDKVVSKGKNASGNSSFSRGKEDGPLSLHESTIMMNADTGQSPPKSDRESMEDISQNPTEQMNGQINYDEICNIKNLKDEEMLQRVPELVQALRGLDEYDRAETMKILKSVGDTYWNFRAIRNKIGNALADEGFAEITMKILKTLNGKGIFKNDSIWFPVYYCFNTLWNYSDASLKLAKSIADHDGVRFFTINCDHEPYIKNLHSKNVYYVVKASMSILHNISRTTDIHHYFKENGTTEVMLKFATWKDLTYEMLKVMSLLTLAHIVEEEDNDKLIDETGAIESCIKYITKALKNSKRRHLGFTPQEVMDGLSKLAVNDKNKKKIIEAGALPVFLEMLKGEHTEEQAITARAIWNLSFDKEVCQQIVEYPEMIERLESLTNSQDKIVAKNVSGALFVLKGENDVSKRPKSAKKNKGHVFISYSWNEKEIVMKIRERLKKEGVEVWIDVERMGGSTLSAMAEAVENAALVLICMSEKYKESPNCRLEAEYTFQLRKEYIPLMVQKRYRPDGWLGMILGAKLYFDFSGKYPFEKPWNGLMKELKSIGRLSVLENPTTDKTDAPVSSSSSLQGSQPIRQSSTASKVYQMNTEDVSNWLCSLKLDGCVPSFAQFDGKLLAQLKSMKSEAAEFYYHCLEKNMNMNLVEILTFTEGLEKL